MYTLNKMTDNCLSSVSRTKTRDKIATLCSTQCSKKGHSGKRRHLIKTSKCFSCLLYKRTDNLGMCKGKIVKTNDTPNASTDVSSYNRRAAEIC